MEGYDLSLIGQSVPKLDGHEKVSGTAKYTTDYIDSSMLHAKMVTSPYAHAKIKLINIEKAKAMPGVKAVLTGDSFTHPIGVLYEDRPILAKDKVRYHGEAVAVVVANSQFEAKKAAEAIEIEYEPLPVVNTPSQAFAPDATLVHENMGSYRILKPVTPIPNTNIANHAMIRKGNMQQGFDQSDVVVEEYFSLPQSDHVAMETRNVRAEIKEDGRVMIHTSSQAPFIVRKLLSRYFGVQEGKIVVNTPYVGGAFGGKAAVELEFIAYLASKAAGGKMVQLINSREEDMITSPVKIGMEAKIKLGCTKDGELKAAEITFFVDGGAYSNMAVGITKSMATDCTGPYRVENVWCDAYCMYTNHPYATSFRGFGHGEFTFAIERTMDILAQKLGIDPMDFRLKNAIQQGDTSPTQAKITNSNAGDLTKCLLKLKELTNWNEGNRIDLGNGKIRAKGVSCIWKAPSTPTDAVSGAIVTFNSDGSVNLSIGSVELGPGTKTIFAQMLAEELGVEVEKIHVTMDVNTELNPVHWKTVASMSTYMVGRAIEEAAKDVIDQLKSMGSIALKCPPQDLCVGGSRVYVKDDPSFYKDITELVYGYKYENGSSIGGQIIGHGSFIMRHVTKLDPETGMGKPGPSWTLGAQAVEVEFDTKYCTYKVLKAFSVIDAGKVINPLSSKGVVMGGMNMGLGIATREGFIFNDLGIVQNNQLRTYKLITFDENPEYTVEFIETPQIDAAYGGRGIGEHGLIGMPGALGNALSLAASTKLNNLPLIPETIWKAKRWQAQ
jgi:CO/xanthine dehydrogenase Mo-binding subunit